MGNWSKEIVVKLAKYVSLDNVPKLQGCYLVKLKDPNIILGQGGVDEAKAIAEEPESTVDAQINDFFSWWR